MNQAHPPLHSPALRSLAYLRVIARWIVAGVFIYAAIPKLIDPAAFAQDIANYGLPHWLWNAGAAIVPPLELVGALALLWPRRQQAGAFILATLLVIFTLLIMSVIFRGIDISCGCFGKSADASPIGWSNVARNFGLMFLLGFGAARRTPVT